MQTVIHKGAWKYKPTDFDEVRDLVKERRHAKDYERRWRVRNFYKEMKQAEDV
jgi:hypothetical protein